MSDETSNRKNRSIRFSDYEWAVVLKAAARAGKTPGAFVHDAAVEALSQEDVDALSAEVKAMIRELRGRLVDE